MKDDLFMKSLSLFFVVAGYGKEVHKKSLPLHKGGLIFLPFFIAKSVFRLAYSERHKEFRAYRFQMRGRPASRLQKVLLKERLPKAQLRLQG